MGIFFSVMLPVIAVFGAGYVLQRVKLVQVKSVAAVSIYIFMPIFFFVSLYEATFDEDYFILIISIIFILLMMVLINKILGKIFKWSKPVESASILGSAFMNGGNYGIPVIVFSLGVGATHFAVFYMVMQSLFIQFFGVYYASRGKDGMLQGIKQVLLMPATYAALLAFLFKGFGWEIPEGVYGTIKMVSEGSIPLMMIVLGMQLATIKTLKVNWQVLTSAVTLRMIISPILAYFFIKAFDLDPLAGGVVLVMSAMPSSASAAMFAIEFDTEPELVSSVMLITTLFSFVSITVLLNILAS
ncbi:AEC family transporter [Metabacillus fastidiosus]|uniref:AEC family transporter n=1 Tax=Metabacillus fastidiosus TaxID=1458 RepID=A0ABU6P030_9BACI|nr:AEC family transporter [Metabacillus fastidiosus]MED4401844.1 AEC family transporter [Metabacillus fastidiosus]MED4463473.1 AEC family transporter [Metabacillus fastidiosus]